MSARERVPRRGVSGRTHRSAPTRCGKRSRDNGNWHGKRTFPLRGGTEPAPYRGAEQNGCGGVWSPRPTGATQVVPSNGPMWASAPTPCGGRHAGGVVPYGWLRRAAAIALASGAQRSVCASGCKEMGGNCGRDHPQSVQQRRTIPQSACGCQLPLHKGAFGTGMRIAASALRASSQ